MTNNSDQKTADDYIACTTCQGSGMMVAFGNETYDCTKCGGGGCVEKPTTPSIEQREAEIRAKAVEIYGSMIFMQSRDPVEFIIDMAHWMRLEERKLLDECRANLHLAESENYKESFQGIVAKLAQSEKRERIMREAIEFILKPCHEGNPFVTMSDGFKKLREALKAAAGEVK